MKRVNRILIAILLSTISTGSLSSCAGANTNTEAAAAERKPVPAKTPYPAPSGVRLYEEVKIGTAGNRSLYTSIAVPETAPPSPMPVVVYIHGGGWNHGTRKDSLGTICGYVREKGYIGVTLDYRLTPEAPFPAQIEDVKLAIRYLRANADKYYIDTDRIGVWGVSAGAHLAALLGTSGDHPELEGMGGWQEYSDKVQAVVDNYGPTDITSKQAADNSSVIALLGGKTPAEVPELAKMVMPGTFVSPDNPPFIIRHGDADPTVPYTDSVSFSKQLQAAGVYCDFQIVPGARHGFKWHTQEQQIADEEWAFLDQFVKNRVVTEHIVYKPVTLDKTSLSLVTGGSAQLTAKINTPGLAQQSITWSTEDGSVAAIDTSGAVAVVKAVAPGKTKIRGAVVETIIRENVHYRNEYVADCEVTVSF